MHTLAWPEEHPYTHEATCCKSLQPFWKGLQKHTPFLHLVCDSEARGNHYDVTMPLNHQMSASLLGVRVSR
jgi:hypothetical protein